VLGPPRRDDCICRIAPFIGVCSRQVKKQSRCERRRALAARFTSAHELETHGRDGTIEGCLRDGDLGQGPPTRKRSRAGCGGYVTSSNSPARQDLSKKGCSGL
jgi:hypothetical protein